MTSGGGLTSLPTAATSAPGTTPSAPAPALTPELQAQLVPNLQKLVEALGALTAALGGPNGVAALTPAPGTGAAAPAAPPTPPTTGGGAPAPTTPPPAPAAPARPPAPSAPASNARAGVLLIGDSLSVGTKQYLNSQMAGQPVEINATGGISLAEGMRRYNATKDKPRVVEMALFTNNSPGQIGELRSAIEKTIADARERGGKVVWATIVRPGNYGPVNDMIRDFAAKNPDVMGLVDWAKMVQEHPNYVGSDGIHSGATGYKARAQAFADAAK
jgi:hypothetical protein